MVGLQTYQRDLSIPLLFGDGDLVPPNEPTLLGLIGKYMLREPKHSVIEVSLEHVRYKPHVAISATYAIKLGNGVQSVVTYRAHRGGKWDTYAQDGLPTSYDASANPALHSVAALPGQQATLWTFPADRVLRGASRALDLRRTARIVDEFGGYAPAQMRLRASRLNLLRYKPERRAVFQLQAKLRGPAGEKSDQTFALRVLPQEDAARIAGFRKTLQEQAPALAQPALLAWDEGAGILVEPWLVGVSNSPTGLDCVSEAMALLAPLHQAGDVPATQTSPPADSMPYFHFQAELARRADRMVLGGAQPARCWIHGDFHPDQLLMGERWHLLDWDCLRPGIPEEDLSQWITDELAADPQRTYQTAVNRLLEAYAHAGGLAIDPESLRLWVIRRLVERAASGLQRLQLGAQERAQLLLQRAWNLQAGRIQ